MRRLLSEGLAAPPLPSSSSPRCLGATSKTSQMGSRQVTLTPAVNDNYMYPCKGIQDGAAGLLVSRGGVAPSRMLDAVVGECGGRCKAEAS